MSRGLVLLKDYAHQDRMEVRIMKNMQRYEMKRYTALFLLLILLSGLFTGCDIPDAEYRPREHGYKWVCDEIDMWFLRVDHGQNYHFIGELTLEGETIPIRVIFPIGGGTDVYDFAGMDDLVLHNENMRFYGRSRFRDGLFTIKVNKEYTDYVGFEELTFNRLELDEEDFNWVEAEYPEWIVDENGIRVS